MHKSFDRLMKNTNISRRDLARIFGITAGGAATLGMSESSLASMKLLQVGDGDRPEIVVSITGLPSVLDPAMGGTSSIVGTRVGYTIYDAMIDNNFLGGDTPGAPTDVIPWLAESWERIDDLNLEVKLRTDVKFHDGTQLTAEDVKFTIERIIGPDADPRFAVVSSSYASYDHVEVVDDHTLRIVTIAPDPVIELRLASVYILPKTYIESVGTDEFALNPVGTGPYKVSEFTPGELLVLEAFDDYWGGLPPFSKVTIRVIPEVSTRIAAIQSGETQIATSIPPDQVAILESDESLNIQSIASANAHFLFYNTHQPVLSPKEMRQGLNLAIDRQLLIDSLWLGHAEPMRGNQIPEWGSMYNPDRPHLEYNPDRARELIDASGYDGTEIVFNAHPAYYTLGADAAQAIVSMWQAVGVNARVNLTEDMHGDKENLMVAHWSIGLSPNDPVATSFLPIFNRNGDIQTYFWTPGAEDFNEMLDLLTGTLDQEQRYNAYQRVLDIFDDEAPWTLFYRVNEVYASREDLGWTAYSTFKMDFRKRNINPGE